MRALYAFVFVTVAINSAQAQTLPVDRIDAVFEELNRTDGPGCTLGIFEGGEISYANGYGMANLEYGIALRPDSVFHIASISKQFTAFAVELLVSEGRVSWDDPIQMYVPEIPEYEWPITLRHLVHHTSGIRDQWNLLLMAGWRWEADLVTQANAIELMSGQTALNFEPGARELYSNSGYTLLAAAVERVSGQTLKDFTHERIFLPLGMASTHFHDDHETIVRNRAYGYRQDDDEGWKISIPDFAIVGATSLFTTVEDMNKWDRNLRDHRIGDDALYERFFAPGVLNDGEQINYAHGVALVPYRGQMRIIHGGGDAGYRTMYMRFPAHDLGIVSFCNFAAANPGRYAEQVADIVLEGVLDEQADTNPEPPEIDNERWVQSPLELEGFYRGSLYDVPMRIWIHEGKARIGFGFGGEECGALLIPQGGDRYQPWPENDIITIVPAAGDQPGYIQAENVRHEYVGPLLDSVDVTPYLGTYWSEELGTEYRVEPGDKDSDIVLKHRRQLPVGYHRAYADGFGGSFGWLTFTRDVQGQVTGFSYSDGRVWNVRFDKR